LWKYLAAGRAILEMRQIPLLISLSGSFFRSRTNSYAGRKEITKDPRIRVSGVDVALDPLQVGNGFHLEEPSLTGQKPK
jgi:hypothetical protein